MPESDNGYSIQSLDRAFAILEIFDRETPRLSATEIAERTELNRVTGYRLCRALESLGYLRRSEDGQFGLGLQAIALAQTAASTMDVTQIAMPVLSELRDRIGKTVNLAILSRNHILVLGRLRSSELLEIQLGVGSRVPVHATSLGKAITAFLPEAEREEVLGGLVFDGQTERTIQTVDEFRAELERVREHGYALNVEELAPNIRGIAMPILDGVHYPVAGANIALTESITADEIVERYHEPLADATRRISAALGNHVRSS